MNRLADTINFAPSTGDFSGPGTGIFAGGDPAANFEALISTVIGVMTVIAGIWFIFTLLLAPLAGLRQAEIRVR